MPKRSRRNPSVKTYAGEPEELPLHKRKRRNESSKPKTRLPPYKRKKSGSDDKSID